MGLDTPLEDRLFLFLHSVSIPEYSERIYKSMENGNEMDEYDLFKYSESFAGKYIIKNIKNSRKGFELERIYLGRGIENGKVINARVVFPESDSELVYDLRGNLDFQNRKINVYPFLRSACFEDIDCAPRWDNSQGIDAKIIYKGGGWFKHGKIFSLDKMFLQGIEIDEEGRILKSSR